MSDSRWRGSARPSLEQLRKQAKDFLRQYRSGDASARSRFDAASPRQSGASNARPVSLADAQFVIARESGFDTWASLKHHVEDVWPSRIGFYERLAHDLLRVCHSGDADALERIRELFGGYVTAEQVRARVLERPDQEPGAPTDDSISLSQARLFVARLYSFGSWADFESSIAQPPARLGPSGHGLSATPPFFRIDWADNWIEPRPPLSDRDWDEIFEVMRDHRITGLRAAGQMNDAFLERLARLDHVTSVHLEGCRRVTDAGLAHLARMTRVERLNLTGCSITDQGLSILRQLPELREFYVYHHSGISDLGLANLGFCEKLERVDLLGCTAGDGVIRALADKPRLRHFKSGNHVTDQGLVSLQHFPVFKKWQGGEPELSLIGFEAEPNYLLLRGQISDEGMASLAALDGLFALNLDDARLAITAAGLRELTGLPNLAWLGFDATDETMVPIAELPHLRMLMCQDTHAGDAGFAALSHSRTLEYLWGRRCYNLSGRGFAAMAHMPALRGLSVSCKNVDDSALSALPHFPALVEFMPMDVPDEGFRHVGRCERLKALWCMYCRDTGDDATAHIAGLQHLESYYAGQTHITDRSLEILSRIHSLERITFWSCAGLTNAGVRLLAALPRLREVSLDGMPRVTRDVVSSFPTNVRVTLGA
jgi:hypothetical protein